MVIMICTNTENYIIGQQYEMDGEIVTAIEHVPCTHIQCGNGCPGCLGELTYIKNGIIRSRCGHRPLGDTHMRTFNVAILTNIRW